MRTVPTVADVAAAGDVLADIAEASDSLTVEHAIDLRRGIERLAKQMKDAVSLIDTHLIRTLESPLERDGVLYEVKRKKDKKRFEHGKIVAGVQLRAHYDPETGELLTNADAILRRGVDLMRQLYLSPSVEAKVTVLDALGFVRSDVEHFELGDEYVKTTPIPTQTEST